MHDVIPTQANDIEVFQECKWVSRTVVQQLNLNLNLANPNYECDPEIGRNLKYPNGHLILLRLLNRKIETIEEIEKIETYIETNEAITERALRTIRDRMIIAKVICNKFPPFLLANSHLYKKHDWELVRQVLEALKQVSGEFGHPIIFAGDLNLPLGKFGDLPAGWEQLELIDERRPRGERIDFIMWYNPDTSDNSKIQLLRNENAVPVPVPVGDLKTLNHKHMLAIVTKYTSKAREQDDLEKGNSSTAESNKEAQKMTNLESKKHIDENAPTVASQAEPKPQMAKAEQPPSNDRSDQVSNFPSQSSQPPLHPLGPDKPASEASFSRQVLFLVVFGL